jgi:hypothetical protein
MLLGGRGRKTAGRAPCESLYVRRVRCANSAAKFWPGLLDEVVELVPDGSRVELTTLGAGRLSAEQLCPEVELERELRRLAAEDVADAMRKTLAMLEITGPPAAVSIRLFRGRRRVRSRRLPTDCVDAEVFGFLLAWLLRWACLPEERWNDARVEGRFAAEDRRRGLAYDVEFALDNEHLSEGLYRRTLTLHPSVTPLG